MTGRERTRTYTVWSATANDARRAALEHAAGAQMRFLGQAKARGRQVVKPRLAVDGTLLLCWRYTIYPRWSR